MKNYNSKLELARKRMIEEKMKKLKEINELQEDCIKNCNMLSKAHSNEVKRYEKLEEKRKEILTELDVLAK